MKRGPGKHGALIVFEGIDGSGKSTQQAKLAARLSERGRRVVATREPYASPAGDRIRALARSGASVAPEQELALFFEQRRAHVREVVRPALARGDVVLCDRYFLSTVAYQGARGLDAEAILLASEREFPLPDLVLWLDLPVAEGLARALARGTPHEPAFEERERLLGVRERLAAIDRPYLARIDARGDPEAVHARVVAALDARLSL